MRTILYIGNHLSMGGSYPSVAETMAPLLLPEVELRLVSRHKNRSLRLVVMLLSILRYGRTEQPVIIDVYSTANFYYALIGGVICQALRFNYCCVLHGGNLPARLVSHPSLCHRLFSRANAIIAPSGYLQHAFKQAGYESQVIPNFIPIENYPFRERKAVQPRLLWVRAFDVIYNPQMAIRALHRLLKVYPDATLCMVGPEKDGSMALCKSLASDLGVSDRVRFTGRLSKPEWITLSSEYDVFINTTNVDNTPVSVIEALALGLPVVSTRVGGIPFLLEHNHSGLLSAPDDVDAFADHVVNLVGQPGLAGKLSKEGRKKAEEFAWERVKPLWFGVIGYRV